MKSAKPARQPKLAVLQRTIANTLSQPLGRGESMSPAAAAVADLLIKPNDRLTSFERLEIYNRQYWWRLLGTFGEDFRGLNAVLGERKFDKLAVSYLQEYGSTSWNLGNLGQHLEKYVRENPSITAPYSRLALEMTQVEWARVVAFDRAEQPVLNPQRLAQTSPAKLRIGIQPYITLLELEYPVDTLLRRLKRRESGTASNAVASSVRPRRVRLSARPLQSPRHLVVHRLDLSVYYKQIDPEAHLLLSALKGGRTLEAACGLAFADSTETPLAIGEKVRSWFTLWTRFGWLCEAGRKA